MRPIDSSHSPDRLSLGHTGAQRTGSRRRVWYRATRSAAVLAAASTLTLGSAAPLTAADNQTLDTATSEASAQKSSPDSDDSVAPEQHDPDKSIAFYVGKNHTADGHPLIGGFGHEPSSHWVEIVEAQDHPDDATVTVGATEEADMPGELTEIPQAEHTYRYITSNYSEFAGFPAPLTNGGLNEKNVAARDVWSNSREELWDMTPEDQTGPQYSDLSRFAMERASSAEEAVEIVGELIDEHGFTTYGGNSHMFADEEEGWVLVEFSGGEGLWAAERLDEDDIRVSYPGYIHEFPEEAAGGDHPDFRGSENLVSFAEEQGWYDPDDDDAFNLQDVYGQPFPAEEFDPNEPADPEDPAPYRNPISLEEEIEAHGEDITFEDMLRLTRDPRWSDDRAGYGQVAELRDDLADPSLGTLWLAPTAAATAPYIPIAIGAEELPAEYTQHRYLTSESPSTYLDPEYAEQEATEYATQTYKRLMYSTCARPDEHLSEVTAAFEGFEAQSREDWEDVLHEAESAVAEGSDASDILTDYSYQRALDGLTLGNHLLDETLAASREDGGLRSPEVEVEDGTTAAAESQSMVLDGEDARDRIHCDMGGGWADGNTWERAGDYGDSGDVPDYSAASISGNPGALGEDAADSTPISPWVFGVGGLVLGGLLTVVLMVGLRRYRS